MDRAVSCPDVSLAFKSQRRQFFNYIVQWFYKDLTSAEDVVKVDISDIVVILQILGFRLEKFERIDKLDEKTNLRIELFCGTSNMHALLSLSDIICNCPKFEDEHKGQFWEITGVCPANENLNKTSGSSLLPSISKGTSSVIRDVMTYVFDMIKVSNDLNENNDASLNFSNNIKLPSGRASTGSCIYYSLNSERHKSCDNLMLATSFKSLPKFSFSSTVINKSPRRESVPAISSTTPAKLIRENTWDIDPGESSPLRASSPVVQLCTSVDQVSLESGKESVLDTLIEAKNSINKAVAMITQKTSPFLKPLTPMKSSSKQIYLKKISTTPNRILASPLQSKSSAVKSYKKSLVPVKIESLSKINSAEKKMSNLNILSSERRRLNSFGKKTSEKKLNSTDEKISIKKIDTPRPNVGRAESKINLERPVMLGRRRTSIGSKASSLQTVPLECMNSTKISKESKLNLKKFESQLSKIGGSLNVPLFKQSKS